MRNVSIVKMACYDYLHTYSDGRQEAKLRILMKEIEQVNTCSRLGVGCGPRQLPGVASPMFGLHSSLGDQA